MELLRWSGMSAKNILQILNLTEPPFDPFRIAELMGVKVKTDLDLEKISNDGMIYLNEKGKP